MLDVCVYHAAFIGDTYCDDSLNIVCTKLLNSIHIGGLSLSLSDQCSPLMQQETHTLWTEMFYPGTQPVYGVKCLCFRGWE